jgi:hypothetical protein
MHFMGQIVIGLFADFLHLLSTRKEKLVVFSQKEWPISARILNHRNQSSVLSH